LSEQMLYCSYVWMGPREDKYYTYWATIFKESFLI